MDLCSQQEALSHSSQGHFDPSNYEKREKNDFDSEETNEMTF